MRRTLDADEKIVAVVPVAPGYFKLTIFEGEICSRSPVIAFALIESAECDERVITTEPVTTDEDDQERWSYAILMPDGQVQANAFHGLRATQTIGDFKAALAKWYARKRERSA